MDEPTSVLVVDDEEGMREGMRRVLERRGFVVDTAADGADALARFAKREFDLALVDLKMPGIDGFKVTEHITRRFAGRTVVVIVSALATLFLGIFPTWVLEFAGKASRLISYASR